ncbi:Metal-dependent hydrolase, endonuclease/exonuclease/phosphatase family [Arenibacter nanhaiticus]|uniref:Metal-dependent hydrolase, endonuclease/exonuclease/phosphatase family n=1 Tax=Arenibacter nanhaiticus TaxID=558155 RepID=A0A1M6J3F0_9FLAO|nr:Metal-dependent hydrolase, endonuclease/exonuclease/phosphatase family [Arenibacter nanhaiticus]
MKAFLRPKRIFCSKQVKNKVLKNLHFFDKIVFLFNVLLAFLLLISFVAPYISVVHFPYLSVLSLGVPILVLINMLLLFYWTLRRKRQLLLSLLVLSIGYLCSDSFFMFKIKEEPIVADQLNIMSYNVRGFNKYNWIEDTTVGDQIIDFIKVENPDILCIQEFSRIKHGDLKNHFKYHYISEMRGEKKSLQAIYSNYPILSKGSLNFPQSQNNAIYADIQYQKDTIRVYNLHLESLRVIPSAEVLTQEASSKLYKRLGNSFGKQQEQADIFRKHCNMAPFKTIVCGDFNNTQFSNVYKVIRGDMNDSFIEQGTGYGRTFNFEYYPMRIDFILADDTIEIKAHKNFNLKLSDHFPVMVSFDMDDDQ